MPKQKSHSGAKKRFKVTGSGKIMKQGAGMRHNLEKKSSRVTRRLNQELGSCAGKRQSHQEIARQVDLNETKDKDHGTCKECG